jgi:hypothetical protein
MDQRPIFYHTDDLAPATTSVTIPGATPVLVFRGKKTALLASSSFMSFLLARWLLSYLRSSAFGQIDSWS